MKSTEDKMFKSLKILAEEDWTTQHYQLHLLQLHFTIRFIS